MIRERFHIRVGGERWYITAFFPVTRYQVNDIMDALRAINCNEDDLRRAYRNLASGQVNNGLTFSNYLLRESVMVFAMSSSPDQYFNLIIHELHHLSVHVAIANNIDLQGEEVCYINGDIAQRLFPEVRFLLCGNNCKT